MSAIFTFAFTASGGWLYNSPKQHSYHDIPQEISALYRARELNHMLCATFGTKADSYFISYLNKQSETRFFIGHGCPNSFLDYIYDAERKTVTRFKGLQAVFGPNDSFFAWDEDSMRWSGIPEAMEKHLQSNLGPKGWKNGPPKVVALSAEGGWLFITENGSHAHAFSSKHANLSQAWNGLAIDKCLKRNEVSSVSFSATNAGLFIIRTTRDGYCFSVPNDEHAFLVLDSTLADDIRATRKRKRTARAQARQCQEAYQVEAFKASKKVSRSDYALLKSRYNVNKVFVQFRRSPNAECNCEKISCLVGKKEVDSLQICQHDVERLLQASTSSTN